MNQQDEFGSVDVGKILTVTGPIDPGQAGITHSHEHVLWDYFKMIMSYDCIFDDSLVATEELKKFKIAGGGTLVDCSSNGIATNRSELPKISQASGVKIVLGTGWYREVVYDQRVFKNTASQLAEIMINDITQGFEDCDFRAGFIGEIGTERKSISAAEERVFRAAAKASKATGTCIITHTTHFGELAIEQIDLLTSEGVPPNRIVVSHLGDREDFTILNRIAKTGVYMSIDNIGYVGDGYPDDSVRLSNVMKLLDQGYEERIVLGTDIGTRSALATYGGRGYDWLIRNFIPAMVKSGLSESTINKLTKNNMAQVLTLVNSSN